MAEKFAITATLWLRTGNGRLAEELTKRFAAAVINEEFGQFEVKLMTENGYTLHTIKRGRTEETIITTATGKA